MQTIAYALPIKNIDRTNFEVILPEDMLLSNNRKEIQKIEIDFGNGGGYQDLQIGQKMKAEYPEEGVYHWHIRTTLTNGKKLFSKIPLEFNDYANPNQENVFIAGPNSSSFLAKEGAMLRIDYAPGHNGRIKKPFIVAEGFDPGSILTPEKQEGERTLKDFLQGSHDIPFSGDLKSLLSGNTQEYDIIYVDWQNGTHDIKHNSQVLRNVINWVNNKKQEAGSTENNVLLGQSMGGLIGRYTLTKMENDYNENHDVELFVAHDSPMRGANTPISTQHFTRHIYSQYTSAPILYGLGEYVMPLISNFVELMSFGAYKINFPNSVEDILTIQDTPAALQMNYHYVDISNNATTTPHQIWQDEFDDVGYPQNTRNIAISNGNECAVDHGFSPGDKLVDFYDIHNSSLLGDLAHLIITPVIGNLTSDIELMLLGVLPGSSKYYFDFDIHSNPDIDDAERRVYNGRIRYKKKLLWAIPIKYTITKKNKDAPKRYLPYDSYSGGSYDILTIANNLPINLSSDYFVNSVYNFIPVASALDIRKNNEDPSHTDYMRKYYGGTIPYNNLSTEFDNFIVDYNNYSKVNNKHISFQKRNGDWLANELDNQTSNTADCSYACASDIEGSDVLCSEEIYSVPSGASSYQWSIVSGSSLAQIENNGSNEVILTTSGQRGTLELKVQYGDNSSCGITTLTKEIHTGKPHFNELQEIGDQSEYSPLEPNITVKEGGIACNEISLEADFDSAPPILEYEWQKITTDVDWQVSSSSNHISITPNCNKDIDFRVRARNACGWTPWQTLSYHMNRCEEDCEDNNTPPQIVGDNFIISPNPFSSQENMKIKVKSEAPWFTETITTDPDLDPVEGGDGSYEVTDYNPVVDIHIYDLTGVNVKSFSNSMLPHTIDLSSLSSGDYLMKIQYNGLSENHNIIKL